VQRWIDQNGKPGDLCQFGKEWVVGKTMNVAKKWSEPIREHKYITEEEQQKFITALTQIVESGGEDFFGWFHGNIIGDHVIVRDDQKPCVLDAAIIPRPGRNCYELLRSVDFLFLTTSDPQSVIDKIPGWKERYFSHVSEKEWNVTLTLRFVGMLVMDIITLHSQWAEDAKEKKIQLAQQLLKETIAKL
jgi:hypothetical protein